jgi:hypothetical protein
MLYSMLVLVFKHNINCLYTTNALITILHYINIKINLKQTYYIN